jgi:hypothetical protein
MEADTMVHGFQRIGYSRLKAVGEHKVCVMISFAVQGKAKEKLATGCYQWLMGLHRRKCGGWRGWVVWNPGVLRSMARKTKIIIRFHSRFGRPGDLLRGVG